MNHTTAPPRVSVDGDRAETTSRFISIRRLDDEPIVASSGSYRDRLRRCEDGQWGFIERHSTGDVPH
jgi:hypothetical protein